MDVDMLYRGKTILLVSMVGCASIAVAEVQDGSVNIAEEKNVSVMEESVSTVSSEKSEDADFALVHKMYYEEDSTDQTSSSTQDSQTISNSELGDSTSADDDHEGDSDASSPVKEEGSDVSDDKEEQAPIDDEIKTEKDNVDALDGEEEKSSWFFGWFSS